MVTMDSLATYDGVIRGKPTSRGQCRSWMMEYMVKPVRVQLLLTREAMCVRS